MLDLSANDYAGFLYLARLQRHEYLAKGTGKKSVRQLLRNCYYQLISPTIGSNGEEGQDHETVEEYVYPNCELDAVTLLGYERQYESNAVYDFDAAAIDRDVLGDEVVFRAVGNLARCGSWDAKHLLAWREGRQGRTGDDVDAARYLRTLAEWPEMAGLNVVASVLKKLAGLQGISEIFVPSERVLDPVTNERKRSKAANKTDRPRQRALENQEETRGLEGVALRTKEEQLAARWGQSLKRYRQSVRQYLAGEPQGRAKARN